MLVRYENGWTDVNYLDVTGLVKPPPRAPSHVAYQIEYIVSDGDDEWGFLTDLPRRGRTWDASIVRPAVLSERPDPNLHPNREQAPASGGSNLTSPLLRPARTSATRCLASLLLDSMF